MSGYTLTRKEDLQMKEEKVIMQTKNLTRKYGSFYALCNVNINIREKHIYGFIGENGAGKTTLMRILMGLDYPTEGSIEWFGKTKQADLEKERRRIGSTIEGPALYPGYSAWRNLELQRVLIGNPDKDICDKILKLVDLYEVRDKKVRQFSMGMKQRLSIAMALIGRPSVLVLDEPINGLDPKNIAALRKLLLKLNKEEGLTIFLSSHILGELYLLATDYLIIHQGEIMEILTHSALEQKCQKYIKICTKDVPACVTVLEQKLDAKDYKVVADNCVYLYKITDQIEKVSQELMKANIVVTEITVTGQNLEEYFLNVIGEVQ